MFKSYSFQHFFIFQWIRLSQFSLIICIFVPKLTELKKKIIKNTNNNHNKIFRQVKNEQQSKPMFPFYLFFCVVLKE